MIIAAAYHYRDRAFALPAPADHKDVAAWLRQIHKREHLDGAREGFIDDELGFLESGPALARARAENQIGERPTQGPLLASDLW